MVCSTLRSGGPEIVDKVGQPRTRRAARGDVQGDLSGRASWTYSAVLAIVVGVSMTQLANAERPERSDHLLGVEVENLGKRYGAVEAVRGIAFQVHAGEVFGLLGPNGAGKTTTLSMLSTLMHPSYGEAHIFGKSLLHDVPGVRRLVGLVPQDVSLYLNLTARENLTFFGRINCVPRRQVRDRAEHLLDLVGLRGRADEQVHTYSGGMQRRLNLACGLIHEPRLLLLDEPTVGVDPQSRQNILDAVRELARQGMAILYTTHYMDEAERFCDRVAIMDEGRIAAVGNLAELFEIVGIGEIIELDWTPTDADRAQLRAIPDVSNVETAAGVTQIFVTNARRALVPIAAMIADRPGAVAGLAIHSVNLESVFMRLTGKALRD
jgi:ABC-2 type transport system ATP-binding protein